MIWMRSGSVSKVDRVFRVPRATYSENFIDNSYEFRIIIINIIIIKH